MKLTSLIIAPTRKWDATGEGNPLRAVVKLASENSTVECVLSERAMHRMLDVCADEIAKQAKTRVDEFAAAVTALDGGKSSALIDDDRAPDRAGIRNLHE